MENGLPLFRVEDFEIWGQGHGYSLLDEGLWGKERKMRNGE
jgi:hypothetical protein